MLYLALGLLVGTLADYLIHRFVGHAASSAGSASPMVARHLTMHHQVFTTRRGMAAKSGEARSEQVGLSLLALLALLLVAGGLAAGLVILEVAHPFEGAMLFAGLATVAGLYEGMHRLYHKETSLGGPLRRWHHAHHAHATSHFATVLPLWDFVFLTRTPAGAKAGQRTRSGNRKGARTGTGTGRKGERDAPKTKPRSGRRRRPQTSMEDLLASTLERADAAVAEDQAPRDKSRKKRKKKEARSASPRDRSGARGRGQTTSRSAKAKGANDEGLDGKRPRTDMNRKKADSEGTNPDKRRRPTTMQSQRDEA